MNHPLQNGQGMILGRPHPLDRGNHITQGDFLMNILST